MATRHIQPPWDYLHDASVPSLESYELSRLNHAANLRREIAALLDQWIEDSSQALLARWVREDRNLPEAEPPMGKPAIGRPPQSELSSGVLPAAGDPPCRPARLLKLARRNARSPARGTLDPFAICKPARGHS
jgi:hypothetical protein